MYFRKKFIKFCCHCFIKIRRKYIYNYNGKKISSYKENFNINSKTSNEISEVSENYLIFKKVNRSNNDITGYYLTDLKNNKKYNL